mgnify:CR=1 FL=1
MLEKKNNATDNILISARCLAALFGPEEEEEETMTGRDLGGRQTREKSTVPVMMLIIIALEVACSTAMKLVTSLLLYFGHLL